MEINDLEIYDDFNDDDDVIVDNQQIDDHDDNLVDNNDNYSNDNQVVETDFITSLLADRGINDIHNIKFADKDGNVTNRSWNDLTVDEQKNILNQSPDYDPETDLDDEEIELINLIRESQMSPRQYLEQLTRSETKSEHQYSINNMSNDELYMYDLQSQIPDITQEEAIQALQSAKQSPLFERQINGLRQSYIAKEEQSIQQEQAAKEYEEKQKLEQFSRNVATSINNLNSSGGIDFNLDTSDKEEIYNFITGKDPAGVSYFGKALNEPDTLVKMAFFALRGEEMMKDIQNYMTSEIRKAYDKGRKEGQGRVVINKSTVNRQTSRPSFGINDINDLD